MNYYHSVKRDDYLFEGQCISNFSVPQNHLGGSENTGSVVVGSGRGLSSQVMLMLLV